MKFLDVHGKKLPVPSFFQVYNYGGGNGDKDREIVYAELSGCIPALINYYYINNFYDHSFKSNFFDNVSKYSKVGDLYNDTREYLIKKGEKYTHYPSVKYDFNKKVFLLDSGAFNIVKYIARDINYNTDIFQKELIKHLHMYYRFANELKVDLLVSFDLGGKYTEKDGEKENKDLIRFLNTINKEKINNILLEETIKYLSSCEDYYPYVLATIHGGTPESYADSVRHVLELEKKYNYKFWGFALGGIASYKQLNKKWYDNIVFQKGGKRNIVDTVAPAKACMLVRKLVGDRPIHALGCGGYPNIAMNYYCGATSFDAASPVRRVGDGNVLSTKHLYSVNPPKDAKFSKYFVGGFNVDKTMRRENFAYIGINKVPDNMELCGCLACKNASSIANIKALYGQKAVDNEANYYSRQLMGLHAVNQHRILCEIVASYDNMDEYVKSHPSDLNKKLLNIYHQL